MMECVSRMPKRRVYNSRQLIGAFAGFSFIRALSDFRIGEPMAGELLEEANRFHHRSSDTFDKVYFDAERVSVIHGTDGMVETARALEVIAAKTIVLLGAMQPARMRHSTRRSISAPPAPRGSSSAGVHLVMNGCIFDPGQVRKNRAAARFEVATGEGQGHSGAAGQAVIIPAPQYAIQVAWAVDVDVSTL